MWKEKQSYKTKTESTEELEPAENIELSDKGMLKLRYKSIKQLRDFFFGRNRSRSRRTQSKIKRIIRKYAY